MNIKNVKIGLKGIWVFVIILTLSIIGITDASYLTIKRYTHDDLNCSIFDGCSFVITSSYSAILGIPVSVLGMTFYIAVFTLTLLYLRSRNWNLIILMSGLSGFGFLMSLWFFYAQAFILNAFCLYCLVSTTLSTTIFIFSLVAVVKYKNNYDTVH